MKKALLIVRWIVGLLFIFSGLIKVNDPLGLSYKMQEFFEVWGIPFFNKFSLGLAIIMNMLEVVSGVALLIGFRLKITIRFLLLLIIFFSFLTGYALLSGKIKTCGCLGDCLPLTPLVSFLKDIALLILILFLTIYQDNIKYALTHTTVNTLLIITIAGCVIAQDTVLNYLPLIDCLPYKVGNNLIGQMQKARDYIPDSTVITYQYKKNGKVVEFDQSHFPDDFDSTYIYITRFDKLVRKGRGEAKITDFNLITPSGTDTTQLLFSIPKYVMIMSNENPLNFASWLNNLKDVNAYCIAHHIPLFYVTSQSDELIKRVEKENIMVLKCDATVIKTAARVNATYFFMNHATIVHKHSDRSKASIMKALTDLNNLN